MLNDGPMPVSFKERVGDMLFGIFYVSLFLLQALLLLQREEKTDPD